MKEPDCGGCKGEGAHSRRCRTEPGWFWIRLADQAGDLAEMIGSNDIEAANMAYSVQGRMLTKAKAAGNTRATSVRTSSGGQTP
jgi:hypothetical protein